MSTKTKLRLLLIEDNLGDAELVQEYMLESQLHSFQVKHCVRISEALRYLENEKNIDIILSDVGLPDTVGIETFRKLHKVASHTPLVFMTGTIPDEEAAIQALKEGAQDYLVKGQFTPDLLLRSIRYAIERKKSEDELRESEERFRMMADNIENLAWMAKADGYIYWYNKRWYDYTGTTPKDMEGWGWQSVHDPETLPNVLKGWTESIKSGELFDMTFPLKGADGNFRPFLTRVMPMKDEKGKVIHWFGTNTDITKIRELERQKDEFIGIASHELKTPITSIKAYTQVLQLRFRKSEDLRSVEMVGKMNAQLDKVTSLIADLLDVTKIEGGKLQFNVSYFDFNELVEEIVEEMQRTTTKHTIIQELAKTKTVYGDRDRLGQVIINFISNAIKYSPHADKIIVRTKSNKDVTLSVEDFGVGISKEGQTKVFERFYRVSGQETFPGLGLGLYISAEIIERQGGKIWVKSEIGKGSLFSFSLPLGSIRKQESKKARKKESITSFR